MDQDGDRLAILHSYRILDTAPEPAFDRLAALAADLFDAPMALVSLVDARRQWGKARYGDIPVEIPRDIAFCDHVVRDPEGRTLVVADAAQDPRFAANKLVTGEPGIRFYAGAPLVSPSGAKLGALCVLDTKPRPHTDERDLRRLAMLAEAAVSELELRRVTFAAQENERLLELAESMVNIGSWRFEPATGELQWSDEVYRIHGVSRDSFDLKLDDALAFYHPDDRPLVEAHLKAAVEEKKGYQFQLRFLEPDGRIRHVLSKATVELDGNGQVEAVIGVFQDVTESVETLRAVQRSEARYRLLADNMADAVIRIMPDGTSPYVSPGISNIVGYAIDELSGIGVIGIVHPDDRGMVEAAFYDLMETGGQCTVKHRALHRDDREVWVETSLSLVRDDAGRPREVIGVIRDVTARRGLSVALEQSEARYRELADKASDVIVRAGRDGILRYVSPSCRKFGYEPEELIGRSVMHVVAPESLDHAKAVFTKLFSGPEPDDTVRREYKIRTGDGREVWAEGNPTLVRDAQGEVVEYISAFRDITARKRLEAELLDARREAEDSAAVKSEFLANMSHELRTPLTAMLGFSRLVQEQPDLGAEARGYIERALVAGRALLTTVNDILDFSRLEAGQVEIRPQPTSPAALLRESIELFEQAASEKQIALSLTVAPDVPPSVALDPDRLRQLVLNLVGNALKFTQQGAVDVYLGHQDGLLDVRVHDTGPGIQAEYVPRLFQRFSQVDASSTRRHSGTGLGLAICKGLVEAMGGTIGVETVSGQGSMFWFRIPAPVPQPAAEAGTPVAGLPPGIRILLAEDSAVNRKLVRALLGPFEVELSEAENGKLAVAMAGQEAFDLILMDLRMPVLDGKAAALRIRRGDGPNARTPILAFSADRFPDLGEGIFDGIVSKPLTAAALRNAIAAVFDDPTARSEADAAA
ncbi:MAG: PAS domain S-box protein [Alphaproteobacteria bacterium]|nr:PAS domain S-box protein [Alphaproteobacteria bacterium]